MNELDRFLQRDDVVVAGEAGLDIVDVSDPANPVLLGNFFNGDRIRAVGVWGNTVITNSFFANATLTIDVSTAGTPTQIGSFFTGGIDDYEVANGFAYAAARLRILDVSDPANMSTAFLEGGIRACDVELVGDVLYINNESTAGGFAEGLYMFDVSNAVNPQQLSFVPQTDTRFVGVAGRRAWALSNFSTAPAFLLLDVSDPTSPFEIFSQVETLGAGPVTIDGRIAYVTHAEVGVFFYEIDTAGDFDDDGRTDLADFAALQRCFGGAGVVNTDPDCLIPFDGDSDNDIDIDDVNAFRANLTGP